MYKSYYKQGYQPASKYRKAQRYIKSRVAQNITQSRGPMIPRPINIYKKSGETKGMDTDIGNLVGTVVSTTNTNDILWFSILSKLVMDHGIELEKSIYYFIKIGWFYYFQRRRRSMCCKNGCSMG